MNEYYVKVDFTKGRIATNLKKLVQNDYNSTKLNFTFDKEGRVLFKMKYPDKTEYVTDIQNNELIFGAGILNQEGDYEYEIALYTDDGRLTDYTTKSFEVRSELVNTDEIVEVDDRVPILDTLIKEVDSIKQDVADGKYNGEKGETGEDGKDGLNGKDGRGILDIDFMAALGCYRIEYTDGTMEFVPSYDETVSGRYSFIRDNFNGYDVGNFEEVQDGNYRFPEAPYNNAVSYNVVKEGNNNILRASFTKNETEGGRGQFWWYPKPSGEFNFCVDYRPSNITNGFYLIVLDSIRANIEGNGKCRLFNTKKSKGSPYIQGVTLNEGVWYRIKVEVREEAVYFKMWERDTGTEPSNNSSIGVTKFTWDDMTHTNLQTRHQVHLGFRPFYESDTYFDVDNLEIYRIVFNYPEGVFV